MLRKILLCFITFVLMINLSIFATTETPVEPAVEVQNEVHQIEAQAVVIETGEIQKIETGSITDTVQQVVIEILDGEYEAEEFTTNYVLSYDIEGKIQGHELEVGDKVTVQITEDDNGNVAVIVQDMIRSGYIIIMFRSIFAKYYFNWWKARC